MPDLRKTDTDGMSGRDQFAYLYVRATKALAQGTPTPCKRMTPDGSPSSKLRVAMR